MRAIIALLCLAMLAPSITFAKGGGGGGGGGGHASASVSAHPSFSVARPATAAPRAQVVTSSGTVAKLHSEPAHAAPAPRTTTMPWYYFGFGSSSTRCDQQKDKNCR